MDWQFPSNVRDARLSPRGCKSGFCSGNAPGKGYEHGPLIRTTMQPTPAAPEHSESELLQFRREKLDGLVKAGLDPFGGRFDTTHQPGSLKEQMKSNFEELQVNVAGRVLSRREMGKATFFDIGDITGRLQCYLRTGDVGDEANVQFNQLIDMGN